MKKVYQVTVKDATEEYAFTAAKELLLHYPSIFAAIYGYTKDDKTVYLVKPIACKSYADIKAYQNMFNENKHINCVVLHTLFQQNVK